MATELWVYDIIRKKNHYDEGKRAPCFKPRDPENRALVNYARRF